MRCEAGTNESLQEASVANIIRFDVMDLVEDDTELPH